MATTSEKAAQASGGSGVPATLRTIRNRLLDRTKWPRRWWWPALAEPETEDRAGTYQDLHDEASKTIRRVMLTIVGYSFFCLLTLSTPDALLIANNNKIRVPFAQIDVEFIDFLIVGPLVLLALVVYMHIFIAFWARIPRQYVGRPLPFVFNMPGAVSRCLAACLFYWLAPLILFLFALKALPHFTGANLFYAKALFCLASVVTALMLWTQIRCCPAEGRRRPRYFVLWSMLALFSLLSVKLALPLTGRATAITAAAMGALAEPILAEFGFAPDTPTQVASAEAELSAGEERNDAPRDGTRVKPAAPRPTAAPNLPRRPSAAAAEERIRREIRQVQTVQGLTALLNRGLNLAGTDLTRANLSQRDFRYADLSGADLSGQTIGGSERPVSFSSAILSGAKLRGADIYGVSFDGANLQNADLSGTRLRDVMFADADLRGANLTGAEFLGVDLHGTDLRRVIGLTCEKLRTAKNFETAYRDKPLACGKPIPPPPAAAR